MGTHLKYNKTCHPQTEVTNRTLGTLLRVLVKKNVKGGMNSSLMLSLPSIGHQPRPAPLPISSGVWIHLRTALDLTPIPTPIKFSWEVKKRAKEIQHLHAQVRERTERSNAQATHQGNKNKKEVYFQLVDLVWIHLRKESFSSKRKSKIMQS